MWGCKGWEFVIKYWREFWILTNINWNGENPWMLAKEFFAFKHHGKVISRSSCWSSRILSSIFAIIMLYLSTNQLLNGDSAAVIWTVMFMVLHISTNWLLANSPLLPVKNFSGAPWICIQIFICNQLSLLVLSIL